MSTNLSTTLQSRTIQNRSGLEDTIYEEDLMIWDVPSIRILFISLHTIVFLFCFLGNLTVILVVTLHWKMRSITNFCLANLAVADLCVAVFCVFQNLYSHMATTWVLGKAVCKIYHFINEMSLTASVLILVVISIERYLAIIHPMRCKTWLTLNRLRLTVSIVWGISGIYSLPRLYYTTVISHGYITSTGEKEMICTPNRQLYDSKLFDKIHMVLLFLFPLILISILYTFIGIVLWKSSKRQVPSSAPSESSSSSGGTGNPTRRIRDRRHGMSCREIICGMNLRRKERNPKLWNTNQGLEHSEPSTLELKPVRSSLRSPNSSQRRTEPGVPASPPKIVVNFEKKGSVRRNEKETDFEILMNASDPEPRLRILNPKEEETSLDRGRNSSKSSTSSLDERKREEILGSEIISSKIPSRGAGKGGALRNDNESTVTGLHSKLGPENKPIQTSLIPEVGNLPGSRQRLKRVRVIRGGNVGTKALEARRKIIKMLIIIVLTFALCNLPFHGRKIWQNWSSSYDGTSNFSIIFTQVTTIIRYANSAINPLLYAFMSAKFRQCLGDFLHCRLRRSFRATRNFSLRSTNAVQMSMTAA